MKANWKRLRDKELNWEIFRIRGRVLSAIREFFMDRDYLEIESPLLTPCPTLDANIHTISVSVKDHSGIPRPCFLHASPEHAMKKLIAAGAEKIFFLGKVFRDQEVSRLHNPEFTMLEWYQTDADYHAIQDTAEKLVCHVAKSLLDAIQVAFNGGILDLAPPWNRITLRRLFLERTGTDLSNCLDLSGIRKAAADNQVQLEKDDDWESGFFKIYLQKIEKDLGIPQPVFIEDYPLALGMMARPKPDDPDRAERTELYIGGLELANGYSELTDPEEQRRRFLEDLSKKEKTGQAVKIDEELLDALRSGLPPTAGMALGVDRLIMLLASKQTIEDVLFFPFSQMFD